MPKSENQKQKLFRILEIMMRRTDDERGLTVNQIISELSEYGITAERKSIYADFDTLEELGFPVLRLFGNPPEYTLAERIFEIPELKLLVDAIQSSKFITEEKSYEIIEKLKLFAGSRSGELTRQVFVKGRVKTENSTALYTIDRIHTAIKENLRIGFSYIKYGADRKKYLADDGKIYEVSPKALIWSNENYYLVGFNEESGRLSSFRVDKMHKTKIMPKESSISADLLRFDPVAYAKEAFDMADGESVLVTFEAKETLADAIIDRFGRQTTLIKTDFGFRFSQRVRVSPAFYGWVFGFGGELRIIEPSSVMAEMKHKLRAVLKDYYGE